jgi:hypothetical protein
MCSICFANSAVVSLRIFVQLPGAERTETHPSKNVFCRIYQPGDDVSQMKAKAPAILVHRFAPAPGRKRTIRNNRRLRERTVFH